jgi:hypothetical protein
MNAKQKEEMKRGEVPKVRYVLHMQMKQKATPQLRCWKVRLENTINVCNPKLSTINVIKRSKQALS